MVLKSGTDEVFTVEGTLTLGPNRENDKEALRQLFMIEKVVNQGLADARLHINLDEFPADPEVH